MSSYTRKQLVLSKVAKTCKELVNPNNLQKQIAYLCIVNSLPQENQAFMYKDPIHAKLQILIVRV